MHFEMRLQRYRELVEHAEDVHHEDHQSKVSQLIVDTRTQVGVEEISQVCNSTFYSCELMGTGNWLYITLRSQILSPSYQTH